MEHLDEIPIEELHQALDEVAGKKPMQRLLAAIAYKNGVTQTELAEWFDVERRTVYNWLGRFETGPVRQAVTDDKRSGRSSKLSEKEQEQLGESLRESPRTAGYDASAWTPTLVRTYLRETYGVEYSIPSCRRLMKEAGLTYRKSRRTAVGFDADDSTEFYEESERSEWRWTPQ